MEYQDFRRELVSEVSRQSDNDLEVSFQEVRRNNDVVSESIMLGSGYGTLIPTVDMKTLYDNYQKGMPVSNLARILIGQYDDAQRKGSVPSDFFMTYESISNCVFCKLISRERNSRLLEEVPNEKWMDLSVVCYYKLDPSWIPGGTILIRNEHLERWNLSETQLFQDAWKNTAALMKPVFIKMGGFLEEMGESRESASSCPLYVLTNESKCLGAISITLRRVQCGIADALGCDYYLIPSSIHEFLVLPDDGSYQTENLNRMVRTVNETELDPEDILAEHVYHYSRRTSALEIC
ncbi:MAG: DUF5688 family protein [Eubacteriales bacterium]|jgi:hypothetical protein